MLFSWTPSHCIRVGDGLAGLGHYFWPLDGPSILTYDGVDQRWISKVEHAENVRFMEYMSCSTC